MRYAQYLQSETWGKKRQQALEKANHCCELCGGTENLNVHHLWYPDVLGMEPISALQVLCRQCHGARHGKCRPKPRTTIHISEIVPGVLAGMLAKLEVSDAE